MLIPIEGINSFIYSVSWFNINSSKSILQSDISVGSVEDFVENTLRYEIAEYRIPK
jgi:hypothetical protein